MNRRLLAFFAAMLNLPFGLAYAGYPVAAGLAVVIEPAVWILVPSVAYYFDWISAPILLGWWAAGKLMWLSPIAVAALPPKTAVKGQSTAVYAALFIATWVMYLSSILVVRTQIVAPYGVPSSSMAPTLEVGDHFFARKHREPQVGDIVVFRDPQGGGPTFVKRIVALGGQTIEIHANQPTIDGQSASWATVGPKDIFDTSCEKSTMNAFTETIGQSSYTVVTNSGSPGPLADMPPTTVPLGSVFVLGDNRDNAMDSRSFGTVALTEIDGVSDGEASFQDSWVFGPCSP